MAGRQAAPPQPNIFNPDALEQIYAKQTFGGPEQSGLAYAFLKNAQNNRMDAQQAYLHDLRMANAMNVMLEQGDQQNDLNKTIMTQGVEASDKLGIPLDALKAFQMLVSDPNKAGAVTGLTTDKMRAQIAKMQAEAAAAGRSGAAHEPTIDTTTEISPFGVVTKITGKRGAKVSEDLIDQQRGISNRQSAKQLTEVPRTVRDAAGNYYRMREQRGE